MKKVKANKKWNSPRTTIACQYRTNDFAYCEHGIFSAMNVYKLLDIAPSVAANMTILDYGCGTGRQSRALSTLFKSVIAYDPSPGCIDEFHKENKRSERNYTNIKILDNVDSIPECDVGFSMHVIEHLDAEQAQIMIENLQAKVRGPVVLAYNAVKNASIIAPFLTLAEIEDDRRRASEENRFIRVKRLNLRK